MPSSDQCCLERQPPNWRWAHRSGCWSNERLPQPASKLLDGWAKQIDGFKGNNLPIPWLVFNRNQANVDLLDATVDLLVRFLVAQIQNPADNSFRFGFRAGLIDEIDVAVGA